MPLLSADPDSDEFSVVALSVPLELSVLFSVLALLPVSFVESPNASDIISERLSVFFSVCFSVVFAVVDPSPSSLFVHAVSENAVRVSESANADINTLFFSILIPKYLFLRWIRDFYRAELILI